MAVPNGCVGLVLGSMNTEGYAAMKGTPRPNEPPVRLFVPESLKATVHEVVPPDTYCAHDTRRSVNLARGREWCRAHAGGWQQGCCWFR